MVCARQDIHPCAMIRRADRVYTAVKERRRSIMSEDPIEAEPASAQDLKGPLNDLTSSVREMREQIREQRDMLHGQLRMTRLLVATIKEVLSPAQPQREFANDPFNLAQENDGSQAGITMNISNPSPDHAQDNREQRAFDEELFESAEQSRADAESQRESAENRRAAAEELRTHAEADREAAEMLRQAAEVLRKTAEDLRRWHEEERQSAEEQRELAIEVRRTLAELLALVRSRQDQKP